MTRPCKPTKLELKVQADVAAFLARGGQITTVPAGCSGLDPLFVPPSHLNTKQRYNYKFSPKAYGAKVAAPTIQTFDVELTDDDDSEEA